MSTALDIRAELGPLFDQSARLHGEIDRLRATGATICGVSADDQELRLLSAFTRAIGLALDLGDAWRYAREARP